MSDNPYMPYRSAKKYLTQRELEFNDNEITIAPEFTGRKILAVKKGYALNVIESNGLLDEFIELFWPGARSKKAIPYLEKYRNLKTRNDQLIESYDYEELDECYESQADIAFELEYQLRDFLAHNINSIEINNQNLKLFIDEDGRNGIEYPTDVGPIDILAVDTSGNLYAFELKRARSPDKAIGQIARYMGWLKNNIGKNVNVYGVIIAKEITENLKYSISALPNVTLFEYSVSFSLNSVEGYIAKG